MKLLYFEIRKNFLRKVTIITFVLFLCINILSIYKGYLDGGGAFSDEINAHNVPKEHWEFYNLMHNKMDGKINAENAKFVSDENARLKALVENRNFNTQYDKNTYTGYIWGDYYIISKHFYNPIRYRVIYSSKMNELLEKAEKNIEFYYKYGNKYEINKNIYIANHYRNRKVDTFYETIIWEKLFEYKFSDVLVFLLIILGLIPIYQNEKHTNMISLIESSKNGNKNLKFAKMAAATIYIVFLVVLFAVINFMIHSFFYQCTDLNQPIYSIEQYKNTPLTCSVMEFYWLIQGMKLLSFAVVGMILCQLSKWSHNVIFSYILSMFFILIGLYFKGFLYSEQWLYIFFVCINPFSLLDGNAFYKNLIGVNIFGNFMLKPTICSMVQIFIFINFIVVGVLQPLFKKRIRSNLPLS